jgi:hypothetical protein
MAISEIDLQNRSQANNHDHANCQLEKRLATVALSTTNYQFSLVQPGYKTQKPRLNRGIIETTRKGRTATGYAGVVIRGIM